MDNKKTGSFYTPVSLIEYMTSYVINRIKPRTILEPSAGDGRFVNELKKFNSNISLVEIDKTKSDLLYKRFGNQHNVVCDDFIHFSLFSDDTYDLIIGNPPYIAKKNINKNQIDNSKQIADLFNLDYSVIQNLWVSFVLSSINLLSESGAIFFVLPFEFLQVQYAEKLRSFLETKFNTIEIITFEDRVFNEIEQDVCLVYLTNEKSEKPYIKYTTLDSVKKQNIVFSSIIERNKPLKKWSNCILNDEETDGLISIANKFNTISKFGDISPGIVTGANAFFVLTNNEINQFDLPEKHIIEIVTKSSHIPSLLVLENRDYESVVDNDLPTKLLNLTDYKYNEFSYSLKKHIAMGKNEQINERFKCRNRKRWYDVPIVKNGQVCFFKRYNVLPRIIVNRANVYTTDIAYNIRLKEDYNPESFAFCFYNSLTLALCEYNGRFYGGGVCELVPNEFKSLSIPYKAISKRNINELDKKFRTKCSIDGIIDYVDEIVLDGLTKDEIELLKSIRNRYLARRTKSVTRR